MRTIGQGDEGPQGVSHEYDLLEPQVVQKAVNIPDMMFQGVPLLRLIRPSSSSQIHGKHLVRWGQIGSDQVPAAAVRRDPMDTEKIFTFSLPNGQLDLHSVSLDFFHDRRLHYKSPFFST